jgi:hypothetical protein
MQPGFKEVDVLFDASNKVMPGGGGCYTTVLAFMRQCIAVVEVVA